MATKTPPEMKGHRWFAATYDLLSRWSERRVLGQFRPFVAGAATGRVLEIGAGTGASFPYYRQEAVEVLIATEPDPFMLRRARKRARELGLDIEFHQARAEALPFADGAFDVVVLTLVLCTVADPARALAEVGRVLKPDGSFRFMEHVRDDGVVGQIQDLLTPAWRWFGAGCHLNRRTAASIEAAGFEIVEMQERRLPLMPLLIGVARPRIVAQ